MSIWPVSVASRTVTGSPSKQQQQQQQLGVRPLENWDFCAVAAGDVSFFRHFPPAHADSAFSDGPHQFILVLSSQFYDLNKTLLFFVLLFSPPPHTSHFITTRLGVWARA